jgi:hypothetical protein
MFNLMVSVTLFILALIMVNLTPIIGLPFDIDTEPFHSYGLIFCSGFYFSRFIVYLRKKNNTLKKEK